MGATIDLRITLRVPETQPLTMQKILDFLTDLEARGIPVAVDGPTSQDLDLRLDQIQQQIAETQMSEEDRRSLTDQIAEQRSLNRVLRRIGR